MPVVLAVVVHGSILDHFFFFDDFVNLYQLRTAEPLDFVIRPHAEHLSIVRNLVMYLTHAVAGIDARPYFASVLAIHALNVALVFGVVRRFCARTGPAVLAAGLWGVAPVQQGTLGWYAVFGHAHALFFLLLVLWDAAGHQRDRRSPSLARLLAWSALLLLGSTTFGVGFAVALAASPAIYLLFYDDPRRGWILRVLASSAVAVLMLHVGLRLLYGGGDSAEEMLPVLAHPQAPYRVLLSVVFLFAFGEASLLAGPLTWTAQGLTRGALYFDGLEELWIFSFLVAVAAAGLAALVAAKAGRQLRLRLGALLVLVLASYGLIAAGRWWLTLSMGFRGIGLETRYHYLATALLAIALGLVLAEIPLRKPRLRFAAALLGALWLGASAVLAWDAVRTDGWRQITQLSRAGYEKKVAAIARAARDTPDGKHARLRNGPLYGMVLFPLGPSFPDWVALHIIAFPDGGLEDQRVRYVEFRKEVRSLLRKEGPRRASRLVVRPKPGEKAPAGPGLPIFAPPR